jgi:hypothetical protein
MLRLDLSAAPFWLDLAPGVRLRLAPLSTALMAAARSDPAVRAVAEGEDRDLQAITLAKAVARRAVLDWEGIGNAEGEPIAPIPEGIDALLDLWPVFEAFQLGYVAKGLLLAQEGNVSAPSPNGISAGAPDTVLPVDPSVPNVPRA